MRRTVLVALTSGLVVVNASAAASADSLNAAPATNSAVSGIPVTISFSGSDAPFDANGDIPTLYALVRRANGVGCEPTFGQDQQVAGTDDVTVLEGGYNNVISEGSFDDRESFTPATGSYIVCAWLETDAGDGAGSGDVASQVVTASATGGFAIGRPVRPRPACRVPRYRSVALRIVKARLWRNHCAVGRVRYVHNRKVKRGRVIGLSAPAGGRRAFHARIGIRVSRG